jgi:transcriptional repressor NrdR
MKCPFCNRNKTRVIDSRTANRGSTIRRRRSCGRCKRRFTTYERPEDRTIQVIKRDGRKERFDRQKLREGLLLACNKRPVSDRRIESIVERVEQELHNTYAREASSRVIGEMVLRELKKADKVAYIRFASVYRGFSDVGQFVQEADKVRKP